MYYVIYIFFCTTLHTTGLLNVSVGEKIITKAINRNLYFSFYLQKTGYYKKNIWLFFPVLSRLCRSGITRPNSYAKTCVLLGMDYVTPFVARGKYRLFRKKFAGPGGGETSCCTVTRTPSYLCTPEARPMTDRYPFHRRGPRCPSRTNSAGHSPKGAPLSGKNRLWGISGANSAFVAYPHIKPHNEFATANTFLSLE